MKIYFATHSTTLDNERGIASGHNDVELSDRGQCEAARLATHLRGLPLNAIYCSVLRRSVETARIAFGISHPLFTDARLNELNYGDLNGAPRAQVEAAREQHVSVPFANGESYNERLEMMRSFLTEMKQRHPGGNILIVGHRATQYCLDVLLKGRSFPQVFAEPLHWQPYWLYEMR